MIRTGDLYKTLCDFLVDNKDVLDPNQKEVISLIIMRSMKAPNIDIQEYRIINRMSVILLGNELLIKNLRKRLRLINKIKYDRRWSRNPKFILEINKILYSYYATQYIDFISSKLKNKLSNI